jgi:hypothetical protein
MEHELPGPVGRRVRELEFRSVSGISYRLLEDTVAFIEDLASAAPAAPAASRAAAEGIDWRALLARVRDMLSAPGTPLQSPQAPLQPTEHGSVDGLL